MKLLKSNIVTIIFVLISLGIIALFIYNRFDKEIIKWFWTVIVVGVAFALLSWAPQLPETLRQVRKNKTIFAFCVLLILFVSFIVAFLITPNLQEESEVFYIYLIHNKENNKVYLLNDSNQFFFYAGYWNEFISGHPNLETNIPFWQGFLNFLIIENIAGRYSFTWLMQDVKEPLNEGSGIKPKGYGLQFERLHENDIEGFEENIFLKDKRIQEFIKKYRHSYYEDGKFSAPPGTTIRFIKNVLDSSLSPFNYYKKDSPDKSMVDRFTIKNNFCEIQIDVEVKGMLEGIMLNEKIFDKIFPGIDKSKLSGARFRAKYLIRYNWYNFGSNESIKYYKPWAEDLCLSFRKTFDVEELIKHINQ